MMESYIRASDFIQHLADEGLVIAKREYVMSDQEVAAHQLRIDQQKLMRKKWLALDEIIKGQLLRYSSRSGLLAALKKRPAFLSEVKRIKGKKRVLTSVIKQMRDESI